jgi:hypothetical protein
MKRSLWTGTALLLIALINVMTSGQTMAPVVVSPEQVAVSQPLSQGSDDSDKNDRKVHTHQPLPHRGGQSDHDEALQTAAGPGPHIHHGTSFPGVGASGYAPPDTNMAVGPNHILQTVNSRYAIYSKSGALLVGPNSLSSLWAPLGNTNGCATNNGGDVVAQYDNLADRFVVTQLGGVSAPFSECIAISQTNDPTGAYYLYSYPYGTTLNDYPKFGVWPTTHNSAYLATYNLFTNGQSFNGGQLCAYDRTKMLAGDPTAQGICYTINQANGFPAADGGFLPADLDGSTPPLDGTPGYFLNYETFSSLRMYALTPNFATPSASTLSVETPDIPVAAFSEACPPTYTCVPQSGTNQRLDTLGDRLMYRLAFRNFGDHEALVVNHSVMNGSSVGVRWYELRAPVSTSGAFSLYQQSTYAPDSVYRWMGSAAMDGAGNFAVGYSASSSTIHPAIRYAGRAATDPTGTLGSEVSMMEGTGSQTNGLSRWGDYSAMRIDPTDDCTFWYTNEFLVANGSFNWSTFFGSFKFAKCGSGPTPDFSVAAAPSSLTLTQGQSGNSTVTVTALNGFSNNVDLTVTGCPTTGVTCSLPTPVTPTGTSTLTVNTTSGASTGTFTLTITGTSGTLVHSTTATLTINPVSVQPDFGISASPSTLPIIRGSNGNYTVTVTQVTGSAPVTLSVSGLPQRTSASFSPNPVSSPGTSTLTITVNRKAARGTYTLTINGNNGSKSHTTTATLQVQ